MGAGACGLVAIAASAFAMQGCEEEAPEVRGGIGKNGVVYQKLVHLNALEETVLVVKSPEGAFAVRKDKSIVSWRELQQAERDKRRERFGAFTGEFYGQVEAANPEQEFEAAVYFKPRVEPRVAPHGAITLDPVEPGTTLEELEEATATQAEELASRLSAAGMKVSFVGKTMPVVMGRTTASNLLDLRSWGELALIVSAAPMKGESHASTCNGGPEKQTCDVDPNVWAGTDTYFNANGHFGAGHRVGILEVTEEECRLDPSHEAFAFSSVQNQKTTPPGCNLTLHSHQVASVISGSAGGTRCGASDVEFYFANDGISTIYFPDDPTISVDTVGCNPPATVKAYDWFSSVGDYADPLEDPPISAVNESFGCVRELINCDYNWGRNAEGITQDYYAYVYGMPIVKAAGNKNCGLGERHEACPFSLNSICVGSVASDGSMSAFSSFANPGTSANPSWLTGHDLDREEPDVVTLGGQVAHEQVPDEGVCVAYPPTGSQSWKGERGTSLAAPLVTSMITLFREYCEPLIGYRLDQRALRALLRTMAIVGDPADSAYSTPRPGRDYLDGAGLLHASALYGICDGGGNNGNFGPVIIDLDGGQPVPKDKALYKPGWAPPGETQSVDAFPELQPQDFDHDPDLDNFLVGEVMYERALVPGDRVRYTFAWDACPLDDTGTAPASVSVDFDVFLRRVGDGYVWGSQSLDDNNEGFDYTIPAGQGGTYQIWLMWPDGQVNCDGTNEAKGGAALLEL